MDQHDNRNKPKYKYQKTEDGFEVLIPHQRNCVFFLIAHIFAVIGIPISAFGIWILYNAEVYIFLCLFILAASINLSQTYFSLIWAYIGKEVVLVTKTDIFLQKLLYCRFGIKNFQISEVEKLKVDLFFDNAIFKRNMRTRMFGRRSLRFEYNSKIIRFGRGLSEEDATALLALLKKHSSKLGK